MARCAGVLSAWFPCGFSQLIVAVIETVSGAEQSDSMRPALVSAERTFSSKSYKMKKKTESFLTTAELALIADVAYMTECHG